MHTAGPYQIHKQMHHGAMLTYICAPGDPRIAPMVASVNGCNEDADSNARLLAAAPELLEALDAMMGLMENIGLDRGTPVEAGAIDMAKHALAKARGAE